MNITAKNALRMARKGAVRMVTATTATVIALGMVIVPGALADDAPTGGSASSRTAAVINLAKNKSLADSGVANLKPEELRILGTYVSNFYVPFQSQFNYNGSIQKKDKEQQDKSKENMTTALQNTVGMSKDAAESVANYVIGNVWKGGSDLQFAYTDGDYTSDANWTTENYPTDWRTFLAMVSGGAGGEDVMEDTVLPKTSPAYKAKWNALVYNAGGKTIPAFVWDPQGKNLTPSVIALYQALSMANLKQGYGSSLVDLYQSDLDFTKGADQQSDGIDIEAVKSAFQDASKAVALTAYSGKMAISPFGDLVYRGPNHTWVAIPASMNPSTWMKVEGSNISKPGGAYNTVSFQNLVLSNQAIQLGSASSGQSTFNLEYAQKRITESLIDAPSYKPFGAFHSTVQVGTSEWNFPNDKWFFQGADSWDTFLDGVKSGWSEQLKKAGLNDVSSGLFNGKRNTMTMLRVGGEVLTPSAGASSTTPSDIMWVGAHPGNNSDPVKTVNKMIVLDDIQAFKGDVPADGMYQDAIGSDGKPFAKARDIDSKAVSSAWEKVLDPSSNFTQTASAMPKPTAVSLYSSYVLAAFGDTSALQKLGWKYNSDLPPVQSNLKLTVDEQTAANEKLANLTDYSLALLSPNWSHTAYKSQLLTMIAGSFMLRWHSDMTGTQTIGVNQGTTKYVGFAGYVSTPNLHDLSWTDSIVTLYNRYLSYMLVFVAAMLGVFALVQMVSIRRAVMSFIIFFIVAAGAIPTLNYVIDQTNAYSGKVLSEKFTYWALVTHQAYSSEIDKAATGDDYGNYLQTVFNNAADMSGWVSDGSDGKENEISNRGGENILLKWQSPKKRTAVEFGSDLSRAVASSDSLSRLLKSSTQSAYGGETFLSDPNSTYLYRSYVDIANQSRYTYLGLSKTRGDGKAAYNKTPDMSTWTESMKDAYDKYPDTLTAYAGTGYANKPSGNSDPTTLSYITPVMASKIVNDHIGDASKLDNLTYGQNVGIPTGAYQFSLGVYTQGKSARDQIKEQNPAGYNPDNEPYTDADYNSLGAFGLFTESPYYHFSWYNFDHGLSAAPNASNGWKDMLLSAPDQGYFYNNKSGDKDADATIDNNGELKDYLGMKELFTYTIPYLKAANNVVVEYDKKYSLRTYSNLPFEPGHDDEYKDNPENRQKYWQNVNVSQLAAMYSPWVDQMYEAGYAAPTKVYANGVTYTVKDPLNPASYPAERPMVFSPSEMTAYGLTESDLTPVESRIMRVLRNTKTPFLDLLNYYTFQDNVLNSSAAMMTTFEFNQVFSDATVLGVQTGSQLYPQAYELKNFSFDAYMRLMLANSLQKPALLSSNDTNFYQQVMQESSITTVIMLLAVDVTSIYVVPLLKYGAIIAIVLVAILRSMASACRVSDEKATSGLWKHVLRPILAIGVIGFIHVGIISLLIGSPASGVTGQLGSSMAVGDPVLLLLIVAAVNVAISIVYFILLRASTKEIVASAKVIGSSLAAAGSSLADMARSGMSRMRSFGGGMAAGAGVAVAAGRGAGSAAVRGAQGVSSRVKAATAVHAESDEPRDKTKAADFNKQTLKGDSANDPAKKKEKKQVIESSISKGRRTIQSNADSKKA